ncbi:splicing factor YJU2-like [Actinia tenebrosa]|uniref:Splicing factor YJU2 n=1 Tax=Actinia tenebrosa TaxID=6105 RepID=A0A6P8HI53_ACTTE|nr:splicing factor YJU2-like [Actinia tenebrosa]
MSERKVLNKYYPPDFDPTKIPKLKLPKDRQYVVRLMAPFNMRCTTCGEYIYKGKKFNARKETVQGETYLGLLIFRFYIRCPKCISEITFKTDPENTDYVCERGATRNFQAQLMMERQEEETKKEKEEEELNNPMKALENRTKESKQEMDILEKLEELKDLNTRQAEVDYEKMLELYSQYEKEVKEKEEKEDEDLVKSIFGSNKIQRRLDDSDSDDSSEGSQEKLVKSSKQTETGKKRATDVLTKDSESEPPSKKANVWDKGIGKLGSKDLLGSLVIVRKTKNNDNEIKTDKMKETSSSGTLSNDNVQSSSSSSEEKESHTEVDNNGGSLGLLGSYGSSSDSE